MNGTEIDKSSGQTDAWKQPQTLDLTKALRPCANTLLVRATNTGVTAVIDPRGVLAEFGVTLAPEQKIRVWDSTAELRYLVVPQRPSGTEGMGEAELAAAVDSPDGSARGGPGDRQHHHHRAGAAEPGLLSAQPR